MFETLYIQNFQAHSKTKIEFDEHVTTIIGQSDVGKSAVIRALRWLCLNSPQGSAFIRDGEKGAAVQLALNGNTVKRKRTKTDNTYHLNDKVYKSFGSTVPIDIETVLGVTDLNFQQQHDSPFWLSLSSADVSKQLNAIVDLSIIDKALSNARKRTKDTRKELEVCERRLKQAKQDREDFEWVLEAEQQWEQVHAYHAQKTRELQCAAELQQIRHNIQVAQVMRHNANAALAQGAVLLQKAKVLLDKTNKLKSFANLIGKIKKIRIAKIPSTVQLAETAEACKSVHWKNDNLICLLGKIKTKQNKRDEKRGNLSRLQDDLSQLTNNQTCPVCGGEMK